MLLSDVLQRPIFSHCFYFQFDIWTFMHNIFHQRSPPYLKDLVTFSVSGPQRRQLRSSAATSAVVRLSGGYGPVERKPVRTKAQQNEIPIERNPIRTTTRQKESPTERTAQFEPVYNKLCVGTVLPLRHNNNGKKNSQISIAPYGNNFTGAGTGYRLKLLVCL